VIDLDTRWPLAALPVLSHDPWFAGRVAVYDLAAIADAEPARAASRAALVWDGLRSLSAADRSRVCTALDASGSAAVVVGVLVGAVLRMESARQSHALCCGADARRMPPSLAFRGVITMRAGAA